ncbi:MAG: putative pilus assembly protein FilE, partial [Chitinophagaceae bacterium]
MVMQKKRTQRAQFALSLLCIMSVQSTIVYADGFYTIIGPDGRPMIVPKRVDAPKLRQPEPAKKVVSEIKLVEPIETKPSPIQEKTTVAKMQVERVSPPQSQVKATVVKPEKQVEILIQKTENQNSKSPYPAQKVVQKSPVVVKQVVEQKTLSAPVLNIEQKQADAFTQIDGVDYVNNEYLEDQEFNLDGKKRFYSMPDGTGRLETIERKKGVTRSVLDKFMGRAPVTAPIVLSTSYVRLSEQDLSLAFENDRCFLEGYAKNKTIKKLASEKEIGLWPRKPLKEKFEYELVE